MTCRICGSGAHWTLDGNGECVCCRALRERGFSDEDRIDFYFQLGRMLFHLPALAQMAGHKTTYGTMDYVRIDPIGIKSSDKAKEFLIDTCSQRGTLGNSTKKICAKWFPEAVREID